MFQIVFTYTYLNNILPLILPDNFFLSFNKSSNSLNFLIPGEIGTSGYTDRKTLLCPQGSYSLVVEAELWKRAATWITKWWNYDRGQNKLLCGHGAGAALLCLSYDCMFLALQSLNKARVNWNKVHRAHSFRANPHLLTRPFLPPSHPLAAQ